jgi:hypothetical protein
MGFVTAMLIVTSSLAVGTESLDQLLAVSQSPPLGLIHEIDERTSRFSNTSNHGRCRILRVRRRRRGAG